MKQLKKKKALTQELTGEEEGLKEIGNINRESYMTMLQEQLYRSLIKEEPCDYAMRKCAQPVSVYDYFNNFNYNGEVTFIKEATHLFNFQKMAKIERQASLTPNKTNSTDRATDKDHNSGFKPSNFSLMQLNT